MPILNIQTSQAGLTGTLPSIAYIQTSDTEAQVLATGYLNNAVNNGKIFSLPCMACISTIASAGAQPDVGWYEIAYTSSGTPPSVNWSLIPSKAPGAVTLPTIANHIATYLDVNGSLGEDASIAINNGSLQAGLDAHAGTLISYPSTTLSGHLVVAAANNAGGNFNTTISNAVSVGQSQVVTIPDGGNAASNFIISKSAGTQHITAGALQVDAGALESGLAAGGFVGLVKAFPTTASEGFIAIQGAANGSGNFGTTLSNQTTQAQAQVLTFPDVGATTGNVLAAGAALVSGNLPKASGVSGAIIDSGITATSISGAITQLGALYQVSVTFNTAQMVTAYDTPLTIVANPAASQMILVLQASVYTASTGHTAYSTGTAPIIQYSTGGTNGAHGVGTIATAAGLASGDITAASSQVRNLFGIATAANTGLSGKGLYFSNATGDYTAGTGTSVTFTVVYQLLTATI